MRFGKYLKKLREEKDISQKELAEKAGVSSAELSRIETGHRKKISPNVIKAIYPYLGVSYESLLSRAGYLDSDSVNNKILMNLETENIKEIIDHTDSILSVIASYLFLDKWSVERADAPSFFTSIAQRFTSLPQTSHNNFSDVVARKEHDEWHIAVKDYQIEQNKPSKWSKEEEEIIHSIVFKAYGMIATYNHSPITKFSIATSNNDYYDVMKKIYPIHLNIDVSILLIDLEKNKVVEEHTFE